MNMKQSEISITNLQRGVTTRGKHTNHRTDFACLLQLLPRMRLTENSSEGSAVDASQAPTVENFGSDNPFAYACIRAVFVV